MSKDVMKQALDALESVAGKGKKCDAAITALRQAIDEPDDMTIAYMAGFHAGKKSVVKESLTTEPLSDARIKGIVVAAANEQFGNFTDECYTETDTAFYGLVCRAIEQEVRGKK
jgi:hypothetical protein